MHKPRLPSLQRLALTGAAVLFAAPALAAEGGSGGMPQLNPASYSSQLFWLAVTFVILYLLMSKVALPRIGEVLSAREQRIANDLDRAAELKAEAEAVLAAYEKALAEARARASEMLRQTEVAIAKQTAEREAALNSQLAQRIKDAETRIASAKAEAMRNLQAVASDAARAIVERLVGESVSPAEAEKAAAAVLSARGHA